MKCYHHNDADGRCAAAIVNLAIADPRMEFIEMDYNREVDVDAIEEQEPIFIVDFSFKPEVMKMVCEKTNDVVWIDHHKTAEAYDYGRGFAGLRCFDEPGESGALLAWKYFYPAMDVPYAVKLVSDYDTWQHKMDGDLEFNLGLFSEPHLSHPVKGPWSLMFSDADFAREIIERGKIIIGFRDQKCADLCSSYGYETEIGGHKAYAVNFYTFGSHTFGDKIKEYPVCAAFVFDGDRFTVSLYSDMGVDTSVISKGYGGGGHSGASGFQCQVLPFGKTEKTT